MKKLLTMLAILVMTTGGTVNLVGCHMKEGINDYENSNLQNDMINLTKIASKVSSVITDYDNNGNLKDSNAFSELTPFYNLVNKDQQIVELDRTNPNISSGLENIENGFRSVFDNINFEIIREYSNYYLDTVPLTFVKDQSKFVLNYIDLDKIGKLTNTPVKGLKAVQLQYKFVLNLSCIL